VEGSRSTRGNTRAGFPAADDRRISFQQGIFHGLLGGQRSSDPQAVHRAAHIAGFAAAIRGSWWW
jgi:hypothetical protein